MMKNDFHSNSNSKYIAGSASHYVVYRDSVL